jgi:heme/copper-type cytochrome/quinol oxidase subunit 4
MNSYSASLSASTGATEQPVVIVFIIFIIVPVIIGSIIDIALTHTIGSQYCSFKETEHKCLIIGTNKEIPAIGRELGRTIIQLILLVILAVVILKMAPTYCRHLHSSLVGVVGVVAFMCTQSDLFEDFRRFNNSLIFKLKHN